MPGDSGGPVVYFTRVLSFSHARLRVHRVPGIPHALSSGRSILAKIRTLSAPQEGGGVTMMHFLSSSPAKAGDPVFEDRKDQTEKPQRTGYPAFAGYDG